MSARRSARASRRGFTLVELMVALAAGLLVASAAYALAKSSVDAFQQEARMQSTQYGSTLGLLRLASDLKRAGYMTSANVASDPQRCGPPPNNFTADMLTALRIRRGNGAGYTTGFNGATYPASTTVPQLAVNNRAPDRVTMSGNFVSGEIFQIASVHSTNVVLQSDSPAVARVYAEAAQGGLGICQLFRPQNLNQFARIVDAAGLERYVIITDCAAAPDPTTAPAPTDPGSYATYTSVSLQFANLPGWTAPSCVPVVMVSGTINPVNVIEYVVAPVAANPAGWGLNATYGAMLAGVSNAVTGDGGRTDLIRRMWDATGAIIPGSAEIVSEYAVDLAFGVWRMSDAGLNPTVQFLPFKSSTAGNDINTTEVQRLRGVRVRLSTRARAPDRVDGPDPNIGNPALPLRRFDVFAAGDVTRQRFARVRNAFVDVNLPNLRNSRW